MRIAKGIIPACSYLSTMLSEEILYQLNIISYQGMMGIIEAIVVAIIAMELFDLRLQSADTGEHSDIIVTTIVKSGAVVVVLTVIGLLLRTVGIYAGFDEEETFRNVFIMVIFTVYYALRKNTLECEGV